MSESVQPTPSPSTASDPPAAGPDLAPTLTITTDGESRAPVMQSTPANFICGRYQAVSSRARGGLGEVFLATDSELDRIVALKRLQPAFADDPERRARFVHEALVTGRLEHPGVVPVYGLGRNESGQPYYAMRFIAGESLEEAISAFHATRWLRRAGDRALALRKLLGRFVSVCEAMEYAHSRGVLHRDLKPGNIMLGPYGETLIVDWGLAKTLSNDEPSVYGELPDDAAQDVPRNLGETQPGQAMGTPAFMSPEQAGGRTAELGFATDIYSLGATLYALLTGAPPHEGSDLISVLGNVRTGKFSRPRAISALVPQALEAIVLKAMALEPGERYDSCRELGQDVERWLADEPVLAAKETWRERLGRSFRRRRPLWLITAASLSTGLAAIIVALIFQVMAGRQFAAAALAEAEFAYTRSLERLRERCPPDDPYVARTLMDVGAVYLEQGRAEEAAAAFGEAADIRRRAFGPDSWEAANAEHFRGEALLAQGRTEEAQQVLEGAYARLLADQPAGTNSAWRMQRARVRMAKLYEKLGDPRKAAEFRD